MPDLTDKFQERDIIRILLNYGDKTLPDSNLSPLSRYMLVSLLDIIDDFEHETYKKIILEYQSLLDQGKSPGAEYFTNHPDRNIQTLAIELLSSPFEYASWEEHDIPLQIQLHPDDNFKKDALNAILRLKQIILNRHIENNKRIIEQLEAEGNDEEMIIHIRMHNDLLKMREQITSQFKSVVLKV
jgi:hypothetical protein